MVTKISIYFIWQNKVKNNYVNIIGINMTVSRKDFKNNNNLINQVSMMELTFVNI